MKKTNLAILVVLAAIATPALAAGGGGSTGCGGLLDLVGDLPYESVDLLEEPDLVFMREEEKLARDVYQAMDEIWGMRVFGNIQWSEQSHMDALLAVLDKYGIADPVGDNAPGEFTDPGLQQLFADLLSQGGQSLIDALVVGATIEDLDIHDLASAIADADNLDIRTVYQNLMKGSRNHLRAFVDLLAGNGVTYEPQFLSQDEFDAIVASPKEHGLVDADGVPMDCDGGGGGSAGGGGGGGHHGGNGPGPDPKARIRNTQQNQQQSQAAQGLQ